MVKILWVPSERAADIAGRNQLSTMERDQEEYAMQEQDNSLQPAGNEGSVQVATVEATDENMKPMTIKPTSA